MDIDEDSVKDSDEDTVNDDVFSTPEGARRAMRELMQLQREPLAGIYIAQPDSLRSISLRLDLFDNRQPLAVVMTLPANYPASPPTFKIPEGYGMERLALAPWCAWRVARTSLILYDEGNWISSTVLRQVLVALQALAVDRIIPELEHPAQPQPVHEVEQDDVTTEAIEAAVSAASDLDRTAMGPRVLDMDALALSGSTLARLPVEVLERRVLSFLHAAALRRLSWTGHACRLPARRALFRRSAQLRLLRLHCSCGNTWRERDLWLQLRPIQAHSVLPLACTNCFQRATQVGTPNYIRMAPPLPAAVQEPQEKFGTGALEYYITEAAMAMLTLSGHAETFVETLHSAKAVVAQTGLRLKDAEARAGTALEVLALRLIFGAPVDDMGALTQRFFEEATLHLRPSGRLLSAYANSQRVDSNHSSLKEPTDGQPHYPSNCVIARAVGGLHLFQLQLQLPAVRAPEIQVTRTEDIWQALSASGTGHLTVVLLLQSDCSRVFSSADVSSAEPLVAANSLVILATRGFPVEVPLPVKPIFVGESEIAVRSAQAAAERAQQSPLPLRCLFVLVAGAVEYSPQQCRGAKKILCDAQVVSECAVVRANHHRGFRGAAALQRALHSSQATRPQPAILTGRHTENRRLETLTLFGQRIEETTVLELPNCGKNEDRLVPRLDWLVGAAPVSGFFESSLLPLQPRTAVLRGTVQLPMLLSRPDSLPKTIKLEDGTTLEVVPGPELQGQELRLSLDLFLQQYQCELRRRCFSPEHVLSDLKAVVEAALRSDSDAAEELIGRRVCKKIRLQKPPHDVNPEMAQAAQDLPSHVLGIWQRIPRRACFAVLAFICDSLSRNPAAFEVLRQGVPEPLLDLVHVAVLRARLVADDPFNWLRDCSHPNAAGLDWQELTQLLFFTKPKSARKSIYETVSTPEKCKTFKWIMGFSEAGQLLGVNRKANAFLIPTWVRPHWNAISQVPRAVESLVGCTTSGTVVIRRRAQCWKEEVTELKRAEGTLTEALLAADSLLGISPVGRSLWTFRSASFRNWKSGPCNARQLLPFEKTDARMGRVRKFSLCDEPEPVQALIASAGGARALRRTPLYQFFHRLRDRITRKRKRDDSDEDQPTRTPSPPNVKRRRKRQQTPEEEGVGRLSQQLQQLHLQFARKRKRERLQSQYRYGWRSEKKRLRRVLWTPGQYSTYRQVVNASVILRHQLCLRRYERRRAILLAHAPSKGGKAVKRKASGTGRPPLAHSAFPQDPAGPPDCTAFITGLRYPVSRSALLKQLAPFKVKGIRAVARPFRAMGCDQEKSPNKRLFVVISAFIHLTSPEEVGRLIHAVRNRELRALDPSAVADRERCRSEEGFAPKRCGGGSRQLVRR